MANPDLTLESPFGDPLVFGLCPSQSVVQEYLQGVLADVSNRVNFERIELETFDYFYGTGFGWHHDKYHLELGRLGEFLFGLCFCDECRGNAAAAGVDIDAARTASRAGVEAVIGGNLPADASLASWLQAHPALADYVDVRTETLTDLYGALRTTTNDDTQLGRYTGFFGVEDAWMHGADLASLADHLDYYTVIAYESSPAAVAQRVRAADELTPDVPLHAGIFPGHPAVDDESTVEGIVDALADEGVERISFYNYGLLPERNLDWIGATTVDYA